ncbi:hypothetical protein O6H91_15G025400 [Diphasiastrum complanatum]|uniref:Uncharacterized protein n=1 Tax=Diphasiastrum complanatum TaxID=34168 RepID=A0ACC2BGS4_DIPCM|nr:hypothetical protein O6H91_15G025400 [Diphasiastrum complanatum]
MVRFREEGDVHRLRRPRIKVVPVKAIRSESNLALDEAEEELSREVDKNWYLDSGATCHITYYMKSFSSYQGVTLPIRLIVGDGDSLMSPGT